MSPENDIFDQIKLYLPPYLSEDQTRELFSELSKFPANSPFYTSRSDLREQVLQGDGWRGFVVIDFNTGERKEVSGVILSNSCDIAIENQRDWPVNVLFAPLIELNKYVAKLGEAGKTREQIENIVASIKSQHVTSLFYIPQYQGFLEESIILLDDIHAQPLQDFMRRTRGSLFTLNQYAFYVFLIKLSIHFCRFREGIQRFDRVA